MGQVIWLPAEKRLTRILVNGLYQYFVEYKNSSANVDDEIYVIRQGKRINYSEIAVQI